MYRKHRNSVFALAIFAVSCAYPMHAQVASKSPTGALAQTQFESDSADRIRIAGQLRTLTQQVAAASCALTSDIAIDEAHDVLETAIAQFDQYIAALRDGDVDLHILQPETRRSTIDDIANIEEEWAIVRAAVVDILTDGHNIESAHVIDDHNMKLLELTTIFAADITGQYSYPYEITAADALMIEIVGRQRMLTQKMAKEACEIWTDYHAEEARADLIETANTFTLSLNALRFGLPEIGVKEAPNDQIRGELDSLLARWEIINANLQVLINGGDLVADQKNEIFHDFQIGLAELEHLLDDYSAHAQRGPKL